MMLTAMFELCQVDDRGVLEAVAVARRVGADAHEERAALDRAEDRHAARQAVDGRRDLEVGAVGEVERVERVDPARRNGVGHVAIHVEDRAGHLLLILAEVEAREARGRGAVRDVPRFERVLRAEPAGAARRRPHVAREDAVVGPRLRHGIEDVRLLELIAERPGRLELGVQADDARGIAHVDDRDDRELVALVGAAGRAPHDALRGILPDRHAPVLDDHERVRRRGDRDAVEVAVVRRVLVVELDAAALEDLELVDDGRVLGVGDVERVDPRLLLRRREPRRLPAVPVRLRLVGHDVDGVVDLARHALAELAHDVGGLEQLRVRGIGDVDRDELRDVAAVEHERAVLLREIEHVGEERVDGGALDEHLDGRAVDGQPAEELRVLRVGHVVREEAPVGVEIEEAVVVDAVDVGLLDVGDPATWGRGSRAPRGPCCRWWRRRRSSLRRPSPCRRRGPRS